MIYTEIINKYITNNLCKTVYYIHCTLVTQKALKAASKLNLKPEQLTFIEEAAMLHDIGIEKTYDPELGCFGKLEYISHGIEGEKILKSEGLPKHANVAATHTGVGITKEEIVRRKLPLPKKDYIPTTLEEKIISWADLFYSKYPKVVFKEKSVKEVQEYLSKYDVVNVEVFNEWQEKFG